MRPLRELTDERLRSLIGVVFDVDDTLTTRGLLTEEAFAALWRLASASLRLVAVTGRPLGWADAMASVWPIDAAVGENGAGWAWRDGAAIRTGYFDDRETRDTQAILLARVRRDVARRMPEVQTASDQGARRCDLAFDVGEREALDRAKIDALVALIERAGARSLVSSVHAHAIPGTWDKASGTRRALQESLSADVAAERERWLFVGDSGNDAAAFAFFSLSVGVANVREHLARLPVPPAYVTERERGAGFAELAARIGEARRG